MINDMTDVFFLLATIIVLLFVVIWLVQFVYTVFVNLSDRRYIKNLHKKDKNK